MKAREWWLVSSKTNGWQARVNKPAGDSVHVIEAAPVLKEIKRLNARVKELERLISDTYAAQNG